MMSNNISTQKPLNYIGKPHKRIVSREKVTGNARYTSEIKVKDLCYSILITSSIPAGKVKAINTSKAENVKGVIKVFTHENFPKTGDIGLYGTGGRGGSTFSPLQNAEIRYSGQIIGLVLAETIEIAEYAASLVETSYETSIAKSNIEEEKENAIELMKMSRGDLSKGDSSADFKMNMAYEAPMLHHNPLEPAATLAVWSENKDQVTVYVPSQGVQSMQMYLSRGLKMPSENIRIVSEFVGGGFGVKGTGWFDTVIAVLASKEIGRPVKQLPSRENLYGIWGNRPKTIQKINIGAKNSGALTTYDVEALASTSITDNFGYPAIVTGHLMMNKCPNASAVLKLVPLNFNTPTPMRGPGECEVHASHSIVLDELAWKLNKNPIDIIKINYADKDYQENLPWSSNGLLSCLQKASDSIGWSDRNHKPRSMNENGMLVGYGVGIGAYPVYISPCVAKTRVKQDGTIEVMTASHSIGQGNYTVIALAAAEGFSIPVDKIKVKLGDTNLPPSPLTGGSKTAGSVTPAVVNSCKDAIAVIKDLAVKDKDGVFFNYKPEKLEVSKGLISYGSRSEKITEVLERNKLQYVEGYGEYIPPTGTSADLNRIRAGGTALVGPNLKTHMGYSFCAVCVKVRVNPITGMYKIEKVTSAVDGGKIINPKTAASQVKGGFIMGAGYACSEETAIDHRLHRIVNGNFADYHIPVQADIPDIDVIFVETNDEVIGGFGIKGVGEVSICGVPGAIANALSHATGIRQRHFPILPEHLIKNEN